MFIASAPGRVNLLGEHTDYNDGFVLPAPIPQEAHVALEPRDDECVIVTSHELHAIAGYRLGEEHQVGDWSDYVQGCTAALRATGHQLSGAEIQLRSEVPFGTGLSASAALEVAVLRAFRSAFKLALDDTTLALLGQRAENELVGAHVGVPVGVTDQLASSLGVPGCALFIDIQSLDVRRLRLPVADLIVIASGIPHDHASSGERLRHAECQQAAELLGVGSLRQLAEADLPRVAHLPDALARRVRHVITENARVLAAVSALEHGDAVRLGQLFEQSHASLRDDYEVSLPAIDILVDSISTQAGVHGARLTGGGFGGSVVAIAKRGKGMAAAEAAAELYFARTGHPARIVLAGEIPSV